jgi:hypothetical protein
LSTGTKAALAVFAASIGLAIVWVLRVGPLRSSESAFADFLDSHGRAEDQFTDPLVLVGGRVQPLVAERIANPQLKHRRYAISFLGCSRASEALPELELILGNERELNYFRADALEAIWLIDAARGVQLARSHLGAAELLGEHANEIVGGTHEPYCRSWSDAFWNRHE